MRPQPARRVDVLWRDGAGHRLPFGRLFGLVAQAGQVQLVAGCLAATLGIGLVDSLLPPLVALGAFYLLPVLVAAARDATSGLSIACTSAAVAGAVDLMGHDAFGSLVVPSLNVVTRLAVFLLVAALVTALRLELQREALMARADSLTGLANGRSFYEVAEGARLLLARSGRPLTLAYIDLDDFKQINDRLGHAAGDDVLQQTGRALQAAVRDVDTVARLGGDEFAVLLPETDAHAAAKVLERVREHLACSWTSSESADDEAPTGPRGVKVCIGAATFTEPVASVDLMVAQADRLMYEEKQAKKGGAIPPPRVAA